MRSAIKVVADKPKRTKPSTMGITNFNASFGEKFHVDTVKTCIISSVCRGTCFALTNINNAFRPVATSRTLNVKNIGLLRFGWPSETDIHRIIRYIECALCHVIGVQFDRKMCPYKSAILDFRQKLTFAFAQNVLGRVKFALINPPYCGDNFFTDTR